MPRNDVKSLLLFFSAYYFSQGIYNAYSSFEQPFLRSYGIGLTDIATSKAVAKVRVVVVGEEPWLAMGVLS